MVGGTLEYLKRNLDAESEALDLVPLPRDFYSKLATFSQRLKRSSGFGTSEISARLVAAQTRTIESMTRSILELRIAKATRLNGVHNLLPEERHIFSARQNFSRRFEALVAAVAGGHPASVEVAHHIESERRVTLRFSKHVDELVGLDLKHYGPFEADDVASIPAESAEILITGGSAVAVYTSDDS